MAVAVAMLAAVGPVAAGSSTDLTAFLAAYRCDVERAANDPRRSDAQVLFGDRAALIRPRPACSPPLVENDSKILCEAESGFYRQKAGEPRQFRVTPQALAALARLGFSTDDSKGNYRRIIDLTGAGDFTVVADLLLSALYQGYGARLNSRLEWEAPLAPGRGTFARCAPLS